MTVCRTAGGMVGPHHLCVYVLRPLYVHMPSWCVTLNAEKECQVMEGRQQEACARRRRGVYLCLVWVYLEATRMSAAVMCCYALPPAIMGGVWLHSCTYLGDLVRTTHMGMAVFGFGDGPALPPPGWRVSWVRA